MVAPNFFDEAVEDDLDVVILGDVLVPLVAAVLPQKGGPLDVLFELLDHVGTHAFENVKELLSDEFGPVKPLLVVVGLKVLRLLGQDSDILGGKQPAVKSF